MDKITTINEYKTLLGDSKLHIIKVSASGCNQCKVLGKNIDESGDSFKNLFMEVDVGEADEDLVDLLNVRNLPTLIFYKDEKEFNRTVGVKSNNEILDIINDT